MVHENKSRQNELRTKISLTMYNFSIFIHCNKIIILPRSINRAEQSVRHAPTMSDPRRSAVRRPRGLPASRRVHAGCQTVLRDRHHRDRGAGRRTTERGRHRGWVPTARSRSVPR